MMHDVALPGLPVQLIQCPLCGKRPDPVDVYPYRAPSRWRGLLEKGDKAAVIEFLRRDRAFFQHGLVEGKRCPADILPGPGLDGPPTREQITARVSALKELLGLL
ncbi:hypothetical protein BKI49_22680 [Streptomyces sp. Tue6028]|uniref:hypothetical protein n=1 Tax=Streptomyces sp. Tue6028 TaxID=2036037 RepID=UPI000BB2E0F3|nr:hypothetical protein [Streptomyces sp. Tue6028]PBC61801.1 hypothetical protein BKI49_22680 [Streptomyces sp. Tue6028]